MEVGVGIGGVLVTDVCGNIFCDVLHTLQILVCPSDVGQDHFERIEFELE